MFLTEKVFEFLIPAIVSGHFLYPFHIMCRYGPGSRLGVLGPGDPVIGVPLFFLRAPAIGLAAPPVGQAVGAPYHVADISELSQYQGPLPLQDNSEVLANSHTKLACFISASKIAG